MRVAILWLLSVLRRLTNGHLRHVITHLLALAIRDTLAMIAKLGIPCLAHPFASQM